MNHEKRSITRTESQGKGRGITIKVVSLKPRPLDTQLIVRRNFFNHTNLTQSYSRRFIQRFVWSSSVGVPILVCADWVVPSS